MRRLNGEDSGFLALELATQPLTSQFLVHLVAPGRGGHPEPITLDYLTAHVAQRLGELPTLRWRVVPVPYGLHHEVTIEDPDFQLRHHLHVVEASPPGGPAELARVSNALAGQRLDPSRPLWDLTLVNGLADGHQALVLRVHHALMDGGPTVLMLERLFSGEDHQVARPAEPWLPEPIPTARELTRAAWRDHRRTIRRLPGQVRDTYRGLKTQKEHDQRATVAVPKEDSDTPPCSLNDSFTARRVNAGLYLPMADILAVRRASGVTVTQVVVGIMAAGLRRYLLDLDDLPERPLVSGVPMVVGTPKAGREWGNRFINFKTSLATDIEDPWERLLHIDAVSRAARSSTEAFGPEVLCDWPDFLPPFLTRRLLHRVYEARLRDRSKVDINVNISVVRGPAEPLRLGPARVDRLFMLGPPNSGCGVSITAFDLGDQMSIGIHAAADAMPDPGRLAQACRQGLAELVERVGQGREPEQQAVS